MAPFDATIADTPQIEVPIASSEPSLPDKPNNRAAPRMIAPATTMSTRICARLVAPNFSTSPRTNLDPSATIPTLSQNWEVRTPGRKTRCRPTVLAITSPIRIAHRTYSISDTVQCSCLARASHATSAYLPKSPTATSNDSRGSTSSGLAVVNPSSVSVSSTVSRSARSVLTRLPRNLRQHTGSG